MKVLITGATGLIGTVLTELLLQNGIKINYLTTNKQKITHQPIIMGFIGVQNLELSTKIL